MIRDSLFMIGALSGATVTLVIVVLVFLIAGCAPIPEHCRSWQDPRQCALEHPADEFFCDDTPEKDPERCGLTE